MTGVRTDHGFEVAGVVAEIATEVRGYTALWFRPVGAYAPMVQLSVSPAGEVWHVDVHDRDGVVVASVKVRV